MTLQDWQVIGTFTGAIVVIIGFVASNTANANKRHTESEVRLKAIEVEIQQLKENAEKTEHKFNQIMDKLQDILLRMENKVNRI